MTPDLSDEVYAGVVAGGKVKVLELGVGTGLTAERILRQFYSKALINIVSKVAGDEEK